MGLLAPRVLDTFMDIGVVVLSILKPVKNRDVMYVSVGIYEGYFSVKLKLVTLVWLAVAPLFRRKAVLDQIFTISRVAPECEEFQNSVVNGIISGSQLIDVTGSGRQHQVSK